MEKKNKKKKLGKVIGIIIYFTVCIGLGILIGVLTSLKTGPEGGKEEPSIFLFTIFISVIISFYLHIIIHEGGHYIFGRLTGYKFTSFRIGSITFIKEDDKIKIKKFSIAGTGGQCLMEPPEYKEEKFPFILYNLGGGLLNIVVSIISLILYTFAKSVYFSGFLICLIGIGVILAIINIVPLRVGGVANDGYNIILLKRDKNSRYAFYRQLKVNALLAKGTRIKDMPEEWFNLPEDADLNNPIMAAVACMKGSYYQDKKDFERAKEEFNYALENCNNLLGIYKNEIHCELLFYEILGDKNLDKINELFTKELKKYIKVSKHSISKKRLLYAYELLINKDENAAKKYLSEFEKLAKTYPYKGEVEGERELIQWAARISQSTV